MVNRLFAACTGTAALMLLSSSLALAAGPTGAVSTLPPALQPALYAALARDTGAADAIGPDGCATLKTQHLAACFEKGGVHFSGKDAPPVSLHLAAYGRGNHRASVKLVMPTIQRNRASYTHGDVTEWWQVLPVGFEQGFTVAKRPAGAGELTLELAANRKATSRGQDLGWGKLDYGKLVVTDAKGRVVPATMKSEGARIRIAVNDAHVAYPLTVDPLVWTEQEVFADDGSAGNFFSWSVALYGNTALVGAQGANSYQGAVYVFIKLGGTWNQTQKLTASDGEAGDRFGYSVALDGTTALIGAPYAPIGNNGTQGAAYVFTESNGTWTQAQKLTASDGAIADFFGYSVALSASAALIGADQPNGGNGAAYVFEESGGTWNQAQKLTADDGSAGDNFGWSVALDGVTAFVGAPYASINGNISQGAAYVFIKSGGTWNQMQKLTASDGASDDEFSYSLAAAGTTAVFSSIYRYSNAGAIYVFDTQGGTWQQTQELIGPSGLFFGISVGFSGSSALIIGAYDVAYLFSRSGQSWSQTQELTASDNGQWFGQSVALDGTTALVGAPWATVGVNTTQGAAYFYTATCPQGYSEHDGTLGSGSLYSTTPYQAPAGIENGILGGPSGFQLYAQYSNGVSPHTYRIPGNEVHQYGPAGTYRWGVKADNTGGAYVLCVLHP